MTTLSSANVTDVNLVLKERTHKIKMKYSMHQYSNSYAYFRQPAHGCRSISVYSTNCIFLCTVPLTGMHRTRSPIWLHWHQLCRAGHIFALATASPSTSLRRGRRWAIVYSRSLVRAPGTDFLLTFVVHPIWTLLRSVSKSHLFSAAYDL